MAYAGAVTSSEAASVQADAQRQMEREIGLAPGEGRGWQDVYAGRKASAEAELAEVGALANPEEGEACVAWKAALKAAAG